MIEVVLSRWVGTVTRVAVVVRRDDTPLQEVCRQYDVDVVTPGVAPPDMKASVLEGLEHIRETYRPGPSDCWLLAPADMPQISREVIENVRLQFDPKDPSVLVACYQGRRGHPALFPWNDVGRLSTLREDQGIRDLLIGVQVRCVACNDEGVLCDVDSPIDYQLVHKSGDG